jgi:hypothetical protein
MLKPPLLRKLRHPAKGSALVIVLFFVVLLSIVVIAFLSRSLTAVRVSVGSAGETKSKILAASASDIIVGDLKQEIIAGSANNSGSANPNSGAVNWPVYLPTCNITMIPWMNGVPTSNGTNAIPNLISRSVSPANTSGSAPYVPYPSYYVSTLVPTNRAASDPTATGTYTASRVSTVAPSLNGRYISPAQWNSHFLIPRNSTVDAPGSTSADSTPTANFIPPDWVIVTRGGVGTVSSSSPGFGTGGLNDSTLTNTKYAIGRYAYAVYNEGGLLDMNAAGYPGDPSLTPTATPPFYSGTPNGLTPVQIGKKGSLALADLTQLTAGTSTLTQTQINNIVGWRNYASAAPPAIGGTFGSFSFTGANASNWLTNFAVANTNGFTQVVPPPSGVTTPPTDQAFLSRQQLISLTQSLGISPDYLQYLGTFSRALEQPSTVPDPNRPLIINGPYSANANPPLAVNADNYLGNNDNVGADNTVNPNFLSIRATTAFTRLNSTTAVIGEPLVKTKFPLNTLGWITYQGPSASRTAVISNSASSSPTGTDYDIYLMENNYAVANTFLQQGTAANVYAYFGLTYTGTTSTWTYNHGQNYIMTLSQVAAAGREPDFAELLKATIVAGSLAKAGPNLNDVANTPVNYQYTLDVALDYQVLQIMANLIDQYQTGSYATAIQISAGGYFRTFYGVEDLPYFYRYHIMSVVDQLPAPPISQNATVTFPGEPQPAAVAAGKAANFTVHGTTSTAQNAPGASAVTATSWSATPPSTNSIVCTGIQSGTVSIPGDATYLYIPDLWNPHDMSPVTSGPKPRPTKFRIYATTDDPVAQTPVWAIGVQTGFSNGVQTMVPSTTGGGSPIYVYPTSTQSPFNVTNTAMTFSDNGGTLFREPTMLWNNNPTGLALASTGSVTEVNTGKTYYGIIAGHSAISQTVTFASTPPQPPGSPVVYQDGTYIIQGASLVNTWNSAVNAMQQLTFFLQYQDPTNNANWITYDVQYPDLHGLQPPALVVNTADFPNGSYYNPTQNFQIGDQAATRDPRSARWGVGTQSKLGELAPGTAGNQTGSTTWVLEPTPNADFSLNTLVANQAVGIFSVLETTRPRAEKCDQVNYSNPGMTSNAGGGRNLQMRIFSGAGWNAAGGIMTAPLEFDGLFSQNDSTVQFTAKDNATPAQIYMEDPDGVDRRATGAYAYNGQSLTDSTTSSLAQTTSSDPNRIGLPMATAYTFNNNAVATATSQVQSRPIVLNRPFRSVSEMSYAFRGTPWKNIDFFTPESGDSALLDTFCLSAPPANAMVAGKVDLNTRQIPVLQALIAGAYRDEDNNLATPPTFALPPLSGAEANNVATTLEAITSDSTHAWHGPLKNISGLVGRFVAVPGSTSGYSDFYTYAPPSPVAGQPTSVTYAGLSSALDCTLFNGVPNHVYSNTTNGASTTAPYVQRLREAALRPLADAGQVRVWNLLVDVVAQTGHYPPTATGLDQFFVDGQTHLWVHVAIDRYTGQVIDKQVEVATP